MGKTGQCFRAESSSTRPPDTRRAPLPPIAPAWLLAMNTECRRSCFNAGSPLQAAQGGYRPRPKCSAAAMHKRMRVPTVADQSLRWRRPGRHHALGHRAVPRTRPWPSIRRDQRREPRSRLRQKAHRIEYTLEPRPITLSPSRQCSYAVASPPALPPPTCHQESLETAAGSTKHRPVAPRACAVRSRCAAATLAKSRADRTPRSSS